MRSKNSALVHVLEFLSFVIVVKVFFRIPIREACLVSYLEKNKISPGLNSENNKSKISS